MSALGPTLADGCGPVLQPWSLPSPRTACPPCACSFLQNFCLPHTCCPALPCSAGLGDIPNTRALFERALTATPFDAAAPLWDAYAQLEYDAGSLAAAAAVEQRRAAAAAAAREAAAAAAAGATLDGKPAVHAEPAQHEALRLALLKYKVLDLWPGSAVQRLHFERLLGQAPAIEVRAGRGRRAAAAHRLLASRLLPFCQVAGCVMVGLEHAAASYAACSRQPA